MSEPARRLRAFLISADPSRMAADTGLDTFADFVGMATDPEGWLGRDPATTSVDVVVVDMALPDAVAPLAIREVAASSPTVGIVAFLTSPLDETLVSRALAAGAHACVTPVTVAEHGRAPFDAAAEGRAFLPSGEVREMLTGDERGDDLTSAERGARLRNLVVGLIPLAGVLAGLVALLWRRYLGQIGVRPVDLAVDPATRIADLFFTISVLVGLIGTQVFVGSWLDLIIGNVGDRLATWLRSHRTLSRIVLSLLVLAGTLALLQFGQLLFALFFGPFVGGLLLAKMFDLDDDLPAVLRITRLRPGRAAAGAAVIFAAFLALLSYEVAVRGPEFDERGEVGWIAPGVLGFNAQPVAVTIVDDGSVTEMLYLGGNADLYVFVDPCDGDRVDYVSVGATRLTAIDQVRCD